MIARPRLSSIALGVALCAAPFAAQAQNRRSAATTPTDRAERDERDAAPRATPTQSRARERGRARAQADDDREATPAREAAPARDARIRAAAEREEREAAEQDADEPESTAQRPSGIRGLATEGPRAAAFVPRGWVLEQQAEGDLTGDRRADLALVIRQTRPDDAEHDRALVVLERGDGGYARIGVGTRFLLCSTCYGAVAGPVGTPLLAIRRGVLSVGQLSGTREARDRTLRFRLDAESGRMLLANEEVTAWDRTEGRGSRTATNHLARTRTVERWERDARRDRETRTTETQQGVDLGERTALDECE